MTYTVEIGQSEEESGLYDVEISDTFNPFGNYAVLYIKDQGGERYDKYARGTRVDIYNDNYTDGTEPRFTGFSVERHEYEENGADILEVDVYSFDQFLRGTKVSGHTDGLTIAEALEQIITEDTPVSWNANKVSIGDNHTLTRDYRGKSVEETVIELTYKSENEEFGVDQDLDFFFQERETQSAPRDIDNTQWFHHDIPEEGKEAVNEVTIWFNDGDESVTIDKGDDKLDEQESLGLDVPPANTLEKTFEDITDIDDARDKGEQILEERSAQQTGEVTTYGLEGARPGDLINVEIDARGIDDEFVIAGLHYEWGVDETTVTIIRKTGHQDDVLVRLADSVEKVEMRPADRDAIQNRVTETGVSAVIEIDANIDGTVFEESRFTNTGRRKLRNGWRGEGTINIAEIAIGTDSSNLSRSNTSLGDEIERVAATETLSGYDTADYSADMDGYDVREVGLFDSEGDLIVRAVGDTSTNGNSLETLTVSSGETYTVGENTTETHGEVLNAGEILNAGTLESGRVVQTYDVDVTLTVRNEDSDSRGLFTESGLEAIRDIIADNAPKAPTQYAYGSGGTNPTVSDTTLENETIVLQLDELLIQSSSDTSFADLMEIGETDPVVADENSVRAAQTNFVRDYKPVLPGSFGGRNEDYLSSGWGFEFDSDSQHAELPAFELEYTIPAEYVGVAANVYTPDPTSGNRAGVELQIIDNEDGTEVHTVTLAQGEANASAFEWEGFGSDDLDTTFPGGDTEWEGPDLEPGEYYFILNCFEDASSTDMVTVIDLVCLFDGRYDYFFEDSPDNAEGYLEGPELYPNVTFEFDAPTRRDVTQAWLDTNWNNTDNEQFLALSNDGETFTVSNNAESMSTTFAEPNTGVTTQFGFSRWPMGSNPQDATPKYGYNGQEVSYHSLTADVDAITRDGTGTVNLRAIIQPGEAEGETIREGGQLADDDTLLARSVMAEFEIGSQMRVISSETVEFGNP